MRQNNIWMLLCSIMITFTTTTNLQAQYVKSAGVLASSLDVGNGTCNDAQTLTSLNLDMVEFASNASSTTPVCIWGNGQDQYFWAAGFSGVTTSTCTTPYSGITVSNSNNTPFSGQKHQALPWSMSANAGNPVDYVDVAVGVYDNLYTGVAQPNYFVLAVYESNGNIYLEHYDVYHNYTTSQFFVDPPSVSTTTPPSTTYFSNNPVTLSSSGDAHYPNIDLIYDESVPASGVAHKAVSYVVTWQEGTGLSSEVWGIEGPISASGQYVPVPAGTAFYIDDGKRPDIGGVNADNSSGSTNANRAYVTYLTQNGDDIKLADWKAGTTTVTYHGALTSTLGTDEYRYPRISCPQYFDYSTTPVNDPVAVVVASAYNGTHWQVNSYELHDPAGIPTLVNMPNASDHKTGTGFGSNEAIKPVVTGVGGIVSSYYAGSGNANREYPTVFYSDYTHAVNNITYAASGDFYAFGTQVIQSATPNITKYYNSGLLRFEYWEANDNGIDLATTTPFDLSGSEPYMAVATTNNSGYEMMFAYWDTDWIYQKFTGGTTYNFKPGRSTGVQETAANSMAVYPNPVTTQLNITQANGAEYVMMDITGRNLSTGTISGNNAGVNVSSLAPGMYMLQLSKDGHTEKVKFVKQ